MRKRTKLTGTAKEKRDALRGAMALIVSWVELADEVPGGFLERMGKKFAKDYAAAMKERKRRGKAREAQQ